MIFEQNCHKSLGRSWSVEIQASGPATPAQARVSLEGALARFDQECRRKAASGQNVVSTPFGTVSVEDYARFQALHTRHHCKQMPGAT
jgi:hypothetical protein